MTNPKCGSSYSIPQGKGLSFFCRPSLYGRYVTIRSLLNAPLTLCEVEVYSERRGTLFVMIIKVIMALVMIHSYIEHGTRTCTCIHVSTILAKRVGALPFVRVFLCGN